MSATVRRSGAILLSAVLLASLVVTMTAAPAASAKPRCGGKVATIVGTNKDEVIIGTKRADVIAGRGGNDIILGRAGNDIICGGPGLDRLVGNRGQDRLIGGLGRDRLFGGLGPDRLFGGARNDLLDGGRSVDLCKQGAGSGPTARCEVPVTQIELVTPEAGAQVPQNNPVISCRSNPTRGHGFELELDWSGPSLKNRGAYGLLIQHSDSIYPVVRTRLTESAFRYQGCNDFVADHNLSDWYWQVTAIDNRGRRTAVSERRPFSFLPCRLANGSPCNAPPGSETAVHSR